MIILCKSNKLNQGNIADVQKLQNDNILFV